MSDISQIKLPDNTTYNINAKTVNGHTVDKDVPSSAVFTDQYVAQVSSLTEDNNYRVLLSGSASDNTQTESVRKSSVIKINPKYDAITMGYDRASGSAYGVCSLTQGSNIIASGQYSHGEGWWTIANHRSQHVFGEYNIADVNAASATARGDYVEIVGNGTGDSTRSNARTLDWDGTETLAGSLLLAGTTSDIHLTGTDNYWYGTTTSLKTAVSSLEHDLSDLTPLEKTASGAIATFDDGSALPMPSLEVAIEPQQDLHGYDAPWVGGAGKNKLPMTVESIKSKNTAGTWNNNVYTKNDMSFEILTDGANNVTGIKVNGTKNISSPVYFTIGTFDFAANESYKVNGGVDLPSPIPVYFAVNGGVVVVSSADYTQTFTSDTTKDVIIVVERTQQISNVIFHPMIRLSTEQDSSFAPYSNICPISGWDEVNVSIVGKNIFGGLPLANAIVNAGGTLDTVNKTVSFTHGNSQVNILDKVKLKESTKYTFILTYSNTGDNNCLSLFYKTSGTRYPINLNNSSNTKTTIVYTTSAITIDKLVLGWVLDASTKIYYEKSGLFEGELTASDFEAYNGQTYTIDLDGTRYGGTLDVVSGELKVVPYYASYNGETLEGEWISDRDVYAVGTTPTIGAQVVNIGATPQTYQLTPTQVKSLLGVNNVWADTGDVDVIYFRNAKSTQAIKDIIDTTTAKDITFTKYKGLPTNVQEAINQTYDNVIALNGNMADYYFERQSYNVDDYVRYEDPYYGGYNLYRCIERSDGGSFDYNKWFRTNIGDEFSEIRQSLSDLSTGELGQMTKVGTKFNFGSQNTTLRIGRVMQCTLVITVTSAISDGETFIKLPKAMRIPCVFLLANDAGTLYKVGNTDSNSDQVKALYGSGLPAGNYRGSFMYLTV